MALPLRRLIPRAVRAGLDRVEEKLVAELSSGDASLAEASLMTLEGGGKRLRPALLLICSHRGGEPVQDPIAAASAVELIHMGSLVHDDVVDENPSRRGRETVGERWGERMAVSVGDFLFARAFGLLSDYAEPDLSRLLAGAVCEMGRGELEQLASERDTDPDIDAYMERIRRKTAVLFAASCEMGAICAALGAADREALREYGERLGMAFQLHDDILDFTATEEELGKPRGTDLKEGNITLPMIYAIEEDGDGVVDAVGSKDPLVLAGGVQAVLATAAIGRTKSEAARLAEDAKAVAGSVTTVRLGADLANIADYVIERVN